MMVLSCNICFRNFVSSRQLSLHYNKCQSTHQLASLFSKQNKTLSNKLDDIGDDDFCMPVPDNTFSNDIQKSQEEVFITNIEDLKEMKFNDVDSSILEKAIIHEETAFVRVFANDGSFKSGALLLHILKKGKCDLKLFDEIIKWAKTSTVKYNCNFDSRCEITRGKTINKIRKRYNIEGLKPQIESLILDASKEQIDVVWFDFKEALNSTLSDKTLMKPDNLLSEVDVKKQFVDDINSGSLWQRENKIY